MILACLILGSLIIAPAYAAPPLIRRPMELYEATIEGASIESVDPAWAYDTESGELIQNVYDTLLVFDGEHVDRFLPSAAVNWTSFPVNETGPEGQQWNYRYVFQIRTGIVFQSPYNYTLTSDDVEYSFEREMVQDTLYGPQWMLYEPLLNNDSGAGALGNGNLNDPINVQYVGSSIDHAVESNATHVWFNLMFPGAYSPFLKILCQSWGSILSEQWIVNQVIGEAGRLDWSGNWSMSHAGWMLDHTEWVDNHSPASSPLDSPTRMMHGSGPFILQTLDEENMFWLLNRNVAYWRGWPADYPAMAGASPAGYVDTVRCSWAFTWSTRKTMFLSGDVDFAAVPRQYLADVYESASAPYEPPNYPLDGIRCIGQLPALAADALLFTFAIDPTTPYGPIGPAGMFNESSIPSDFFGNATWGVHVRKGFAYAFDYDTYLQQAYLGEAQHPATGIVPGLPYCDPTVQGYYYSLTMAQQEFQAVPGLWNTGFTVVFLYNAGSRPSYVANLLKKGIESINSKFHVSTVGVSWRDYLAAVAQHRAPMFSIGWVVDFPDPHDFALAFYRTGGSFATLQAYSNTTMDALIDQGIATPDGPARQAIYHNIQVLAVQECPSLTLGQAVGRHFERDWVVGWYYNPCYPGISFYNLWKFYYIPECCQSAATQPYSNWRPFDVNYDGLIDMSDIGLVASAYLSEGYPTPTTYPNWNFRADVNNDGLVDMNDIGLMAQHYLQACPTWNCTWASS